MSEQNSNGKKRHMNKLGVKQQFELVEQVKLHQTIFESRQSSLKEAARILTKACGFPVTPGNVEGVCEAFEIQWKKKRSHAKKGQGIGNDRARPIAQDLKRLAEQVGDMNIALFRLLEHLGETDLLSLLHDTEYSPISKKTMAIACSQGIPKPAPPEEDEDEDEDENVG